jgi:choline monooxygenase
MTVETTGSHGVPSADAYVDPVRYEAERRAVFAREWTAIGTASQVAAPGAYLSVWLAGFPLVVVNDAGTLRAFQNVCRHRAGPLVDAGSGTCGRFVCRYHGWAYSLDGHLTSARDFGADVDPSRYSLIPASVATWRGLLFVAVDPGQPDLGTWLGPIERHSSSFAMEDFEVTHHSSHDMEANWKVYAENYQEGYHIPLVHPGLHRQIDSSRYEVAVDGPVTVHRAPTRDGAVTEGAWLWRFPGLALNLYPSGLCLESYWPLGPTTTRVEYTFCFVPGTPAAEAEGSVASSVAILDEDRAICEAVQRNLASGLARPGVLSPRHESGVALVQSLVAEALGGA